MVYRKPKVLILLMAIGMAISFSVFADDKTDDGTYFKGEMATCLNRAKVVYPCVSLAPPAYQSNNAFVTSLPLETNLPLNSDKHVDGWLDKLLDANFWNPTGLISESLQGMDLNLTVDQSRPGMKMDIGPMKLNMFVDEDHFSQSQFILGIDHSW